MGDGTYPGECPACGFESRLFGPSFKTLDGFAVVAVSGAQAVGSK